MLISRSLDVDGFFELVSVGDLGDEVRLCAAIFGTGSDTSNGGGDGDDGGKGGEGNGEGGGGGGEPIEIAEEKSDRGKGDDLALVNDPEKAVEFMKVLKQRCATTPKVFAAFLATLRSIRSGERDLLEGLEAVVSILSAHGDLIEGLVHFVPVAYRDKVR